MVRRVWHVSIITDIYRFLVGQKREITSSSFISQYGISPEFWISQATIPNDQTSEASENLLWLIASGAAHLYNIVCPIWIILFNTRTTFLRHGFFVICKYLKEPDVETVILKVSLPLKNHQFYIWVEHCTWYFWQQDRDEHNHYQQDISLQVQHRPSFLVAVFGWIHVGGAEYSKNQKNIQDDRKALAEPESFYLIGS